MSSSGRSATSGSRLFIKSRIAASCCQPLQLSSVPLGARTFSGDIIKSLQFLQFVSLIRHPEPKAKDLNLTLHLDSSSKSLRDLSSE